MLHCLPRVPSDSRSSAEAATGWGAKEFPARSRSDKAYPVKSHVDEGPVQKTVDFLVKRRVSYNRLPLVARGSGREHFSAAGFDRKDTAPG